MIHLLLQERLQEAARQVLPGVNVPVLLVRPCPDPKFGDYQCNALMSVAKERKLNPRQLAADIVARLEVGEWCEKVELAGAGFINFRLRTVAVGRALQAAARVDRPFVSPATQPRTVVIDFSSPNVAKPMHVGHIRSTVLGDCLARTLRLLGHRVITDNHIGDWGTQFGKLIVGWKQRLHPESLRTAPLEELERIYREINFGAESERAELELIFRQLTAVAQQQPEAVNGWNETLRLSDEEFLSRYAGKAVEAAKSQTEQCLGLLARNGLLQRIKLQSNGEEYLEYLLELVCYALQADPPLLDQARQELVKLQQGDAENLGIWREMTALSQVQFDAIYDRLGVKFDHALGESFYQPRLQGVVGDLRAKGIARESQGAVCVFSDGSLPPKDDPFLVHKDGQWAPNPCLIQKSDGAFNYATTDLATLEHRLETWRPDEIDYVTDGRQQLHFRQVFAAFRRWHPGATVKLTHVWFGSILGEDGKPFKTRSGETVKLAGLLDEAEERAFGIVSEKNPGMSEGERRAIARVVGIGAVKYADLLPNRQSDYVFSWDKMLALEGNTAPYLLYAYTRTRSLARKARDSGVRPAADSTLTPGAPEEIALAKHLLNFGLVLEAVGEEYRPNFLCNYLYELAGLLSRFWEACPVLKSEEPDRTSRLVLTDLTGSVLKQGLEVLGIETTDQM